MTEEMIMFIYSLVNSVLNNAQIILAMLLVIMVSACFLGRYIQLSKKLVLSSLGVLLLTIISTLILNFIYTDDITNEEYFVMSNIMSMAMFVYGFIFYLFAFKEKKFIRALESTLCFYLFSLYISNFSEISVIYLAGGTEEIYEDLYYNNYATGPLWLAISSVNFLLTLLLFLIAYFGFYRPKKFYVISTPYRILFVVWILLFMIVPFIPVVLPSEEITFEERYRLMSFLFGIGIVLLGLAAPVIMVISSVERSLREKNKSQETYINAELEYIGQYKKQQIETRAFRHDIKNNLSMIQMMLEQGHEDEARSHLADLLGNVSSLSPKYVTGDEMLDIIISMKADKMDAQNITFDLDGVADGGLKIKPADMCSIFANALDNAIEAASACSEPYIRFSIKRTDKFFVIKIKNSATGKTDTDKLLSSSGYTSKKDKDHHGFGLMNVRRSVEDCNGILKAESENDSFTLSIMMPRAD